MENLILLKQKTDELLREFKIELSKGCHEVEIKTTVSVSITDNDEPVYKIEMFYKLKTHYIGTSDEINSSRIAENADLNICLSDLKNHLIIKADPTKGIYPVTFLR